MFVLNVFCTNLSLSLLPKKFARPMIALSLLATAMSDSTEEAAEGIEWRIWERTVDRRES